VFGEGADRAAGHQQLDTLLRQKIAILDQVCGLTETQKQKLKLAGHGDTKRLFDRVEEIGARIQPVRNDREQVYKLLDEAHSLRHDFIRPGLSIDGSLFIKSLDRLLTADQAVKYAPLRALVRAGALVRIRRGGTTEMLEINLAGTESVDDELAHLRALPGLHILVLDRSQVTDEGLAHLAGMTSLHTLVLNQTHVTDNGLAELKGLTGLRDLALDETRVTDAGLAHLTALTALQHVDLKHTQISDAGLVHLKSLTRLEWLVLDNTEVTDAGLAHLKRLTSLQALLLRRTNVTESGIAELKRALPRLAVHK
jgi:Leucine-rich repeat (LRR) protein